MTMPIAVSMTIVPWMRVHQAGTPVEPVLHLVGAAVTPSVLAAAAARPSRAQRQRVAPSVARAAVCRTISTSVAGRSDCGACPAATSGRNREPGIATA